MRGFGEEFIIESYRIPWLIWIQLLVMILLIIVLCFGLSLFSLESSTSSATAAASPPPPPHLNNPSSSHSRAKTEIQRTRADRVTNAELTREVQNEEQSSSKESSLVRIFKNANHPCNYFGLAKQAVLKCLGLDSSSEVSNTDQHEKRE